MMNLFSITEMEKDSILQWKVEWKGMGAVTRDSSKKKLIQSAFSTGSYQIGLTSDSGLHILNFDAFYQSNDTIDAYISNLPNIYAVSFDIKEHAEKFIEELEKMMSWNLLKREYVS